MINNQIADEPIDEASMGNNIGTEWVLCEPNLIEEDQMVTMICNNRHSSNGSGYSVGDRVGASVGGSVGGGVWYCLCIQLIMV